MKKLIILALILVPLATFGASQVIKQLNSWEYMASIQTSNQENIFVYRVEDNLNPDVKCYIAVNDKTRQHQLSCVAVPVVNVVNTPVNSVVKK